jgi:16S rRNA (cytosine967-C5)-methyltransferase
VVADANTLVAEPAEKVIVDAPCSGLGVLRKKPDTKWKREPEDIQRLVHQQRTLLDSAAKLVKPGGVLVYSTCTTEPEENGETIVRFLQQHPEFAIEPASAFVNQSVVTEQGWIETFPHRHHIDGSFAVRLKKAADAEPKP